MDAPETPDVARLIAVLDRHGATYLVVGGAGAIAYGATRPTKDLDCVVQHDRENLDRVAAAMRELGARLRVEGLSDEQARELPVVIDGRALANSEISTWTTDAGKLDILANIPAADGRLLRYEQLLGRSKQLTAGAVTLRVAGLQDIIASKEYSNRPKDHEALPELRTLRDAQTIAFPGSADPGTGVDASLDDGPGGATESPSPRERLLAALRDARVEHLVVGDSALSAHRVLEDSEQFDIAPQPTAENLERLAAVLVEQGASPREVNELDGLDLAHIDTDHGTVAVHLRSSGFRGGYEDLVANARDLPIPGTSVTAPVAARHDVERSRELAHRGGDPGREFPSLEQFPPPDLSIEI